MPHCFLCLAIDAIGSDRIRSLMRRILSLLSILLAGCSSVVPGTGLNGEDTGEGTEDLSRPKLVQAQGKAKLILDEEGNLVEIVVQNEEDFGLLNERRIQKAEARVDFARLNEVWMAAIDAIGDSAELDLRTTHFSAWEFFYDFKQAELRYSSENGSDESGTTFVKTVIIHLNLKERHRVRLVTKGGRRFWKKSTYIHRYEFVDFELQEMAVLFNFGGS